MFECGHARLCLWVAGDKTHQHADAPHPLALLRPRQERPPRRSAAEQRDELAPPNHSITSSARASRTSGTVRSSALAAFRLMKNSNLLTCWTARLAGLSPLRIRPV